MIHTKAWTERQQRLRLEKLNTRKPQYCDKCECNLCSGCDYDHDCFQAERDAEQANNRERMISK